MAYKLPENATLDTTLYLFTLKDGQLPRHQSHIIRIYWNRSKTWGRVYYAETYHEGKHLVTRATGCGYDKQGAALDELLNIIIAGTRALNSSIGHLRTLNEKLMPLGYALLDQQALGAVDPESTAQYLAHIMGA